MGCGQSKIHLYPRKNKSKANGKKNGHSEDNDADEDEGHNNEEHDKDISSEKEKLDDDQFSKTSEAANGEITIPILRRNGPLLQSQDISTSQQNFFRMLDEKIEQGPDYDSNSETEIALEEARLNSLIQHWESASLTASMCSSTSRSLQGTPVRQAQSNFRPQFRPPFQSSPTPSPLATANDLLALKQQQLTGLLTGGSCNSPKRTDLRPILAQSVPMHQAYANLAPALMPSSQQQQQVVQQQVSSGITQASTNSQLPTARNLRNLPPQPSSVIAPMAFYTQPPPQSYYGEVLHPIQVPPSNPEPRFPPAISVQRLAPQVQRQLRETQELIKDSCPQLYAAGYGSPGPPGMMRVQQRTSRRPTLETQYSQELS